MPPQIFGKANLTLAKLDGQRSIPLAEVRLGCFIISLLDEILATIWLAREMDKPILELTEEEYNGNGLQDERMALAEAFVKAANRRVPVIVQVGHNSMADARALSKHAQEIGADVVSATCPSYFKVSDVETLINCMAEQRKHINFHMTLEHYNAIAAARRHAVLR